MNKIATMALAACTIWSVAGSADTKFDPGQDSVTQSLQSSRGLIIRVPVGVQGEDTSGAEFRVLDSKSDIDEPSAMPQAFEKGTDLKGFATLSVPQIGNDQSAGADTNGYGYWGRGCSYYYAPTVSYGYSSYSYNTPVYYYSSSYSCPPSYSSYAYYYYPSQSYYASDSYYPSSYYCGASYYHSHQPYESQWYQSYGGSSSYWSHDHGSAYNDYRSSYDYRSAYNDYRSYNRNEGEYGYMGNYYRGDQNRGGYYHGGGYYNSGWYDRGGYSNANGSGWWDRGGYSNGGYYNTGYDRR